MRRSSARCPFLSRRERKTEVGKIDIAEALDWLKDAYPVYEKVKTAIDAVEAVPKEQRKPSTYIAAANSILASLAPLADKVEEDIKD